MKNPGRVYSIIAIVPAVIIAVLIAWNRPQIGPVFSWIAAITLMTILMYGYDKAIASTRITRVPEDVLITLSFVGGTLGALFGMWLFKHKTIKASFRFKFWAVFVLQAIIVIAYVYFFYLKTPE